MTSKALNPTPQPLPATTEDLLSYRKMRVKRTINDRVEDAHVKLMNNEKYRALRFAAYDSQAVEESMKFDDVLSAEMIRDLAVELRDHELSAQKLPKIVRALKTVERRYGLDRKTRRAQAQAEQAEQAQQAEPAEQTQPSQDQAA